MNNYLFLILILLCALILPAAFYYFQSIFIKEGFSKYNSNLGSKEGDYPCAVETVLLQGDYPVNFNNITSTNIESTIWHQTPVYEVGTFVQLTNNQRYYKNPDNGSCTPADLCNALYKEKDEKSNIVEPMPPVEPSFNARVNYYNSDNNLLAFRSDTSNILY
jgi:hypothetical protein